MRTIEDIEAQIPEEQPDIHDEDAQFQNGLRAGFKAAIGLIERGKSTAEILAFTQVEEVNTSRSGMTMRTPIRADAPRLCIGWLSNTTGTAKEIRFSVKATSGDRRTTSNAPARREGWREHARQTA